MPRPPSGKLSPYLSDVTIAHETLMRLDDRLVEAYFVHRRNRFAALVHRAAIAFVVQREDAARLRPNDAADREFSRSLREAARKGVEVYAYRCRVTREAVEIDSPVPVLM